MNKIITCLLVALACSAFADEPAWIDIEPQIQPAVTTSDAKALESGSTFSTWWRLDVVVNGIKRGLALFIR